MKQMYYRSLRKYKYELLEDYVIQVYEFQHQEVETPFFKLERDGKLTIRRGYCWDGPSGPTIDTANFMRGSLVHDALYQMIRERILEEAEVCRGLADGVLWAICLDDGMSRLRAWYVYTCLRVFGAKAARPGTEKPTVVRCAPAGKTMSLKEFAQGV